MIAPPQLPGATERFLIEMAPRLRRFTGPAMPARRQFGRRRSAPGLA